jgi:hypothetical protein
VEKMTTTSEGAPRIKIFRTSNMQQSSEKRKTIREKLQRHPPTKLKGLFTMHFPYFVLVILALISLIYPSLLLFCRQRRHPKLTLARPVQALVLASLKVAKLEANQVKQVPEEAKQGQQVPEEAKQGQQLVANQLVQVEAKQVQEEEQQHHSGHQGQQELHTGIID